MANKMTWQMDPAHTNIEFTAKHMMFTTVRGHFKELSGLIEMDEDDPSRSTVQVEIDAASIDTGVEDRDNHLRSEDFLDVENHKTLRFESRRVEGSPTEPGDRFKVTGDLTIHGTTREVTLDATYEGRGPDPWGGERAGFSAATTIDRREWGLTWNKALEAGGILVGNEVKIQLDVQAVKQAEKGQQEAA
ncbi:MAG: YceI family protein [Gemmatimonadota bacterium]|jgi:polyisoprenoid-binding protein YceI